MNRRSAFTLALFTCAAPFVSSADDTIYCLPISVKRRVTR